MTNTYVKTDDITSASGLSPRLWPQRVDATVNQSCMYYLNHIEMSLHYIQLLVVKKYSIVIIEHVEIRSWEPYNNYYDKNS